MAGALKVRTSVGPDVWAVIGYGDSSTKFWNSAWGVLASASLPATTVTVASTSTPLATTPAVQLYAGRRYRVRGNVRAWLGTPAASGDLTLVVAGPFAPTSNAHDQYSHVAGGYSQAEWSAVFTCTADTASAVYALTATTTIPTTIYGGDNATLVVEDVGPTSLALPPAPPPSDWAPFDSRFVNTGGDTMTGALVLNADPSSALHAATKQYADTKAPLRQVVDYRGADTTLTIGLADEGKMLWFNASTAITVTIPTNAVVAFSIGTRIDLMQTNNGKVTVGGAGVTLYATPSATLRTAHSSASLLKVSTDSWLLAGDLG